MGPPRQAQVGEAPRVPLPRARATATATTAATGGAGAVASGRALVSEEMYLMGAAFIRGER